MWILQIASRKQQGVYTKVHLSCNFLGGSFGDLAAYSVNSVCKTIISEALIDMWTQRVKLAQTVYFPTTFLSFHMEWNCWLRNPFMVVRVLLKGKYVPSFLCAVWHEIDIDPSIWCCNKLVHLNKFPCSFQMKRWLVFSFTDRRKDLLSLQINAHRKV